MPFQKISDEEMKKNLKVDGVWILEDQNTGMIVTMSLNSDPSSKRHPVAFPTEAEALEFMKGKNLPKSIAPTYKPNTTTTH